MKPDKGILSVLNLLPLQAPSKSNIKADVGITKARCVEETHLLHIFENEVQLPSSAEGFFQLNDILLLEGAEHFELSQSRFFDLFIFYMQVRQTGNERHTELPRRDGYGMQQK